MIFNAYAEQPESSFGITVVSAAPLKKQMATVRILTALHARCSI